MAALTKDRRTAIKAQGTHRHHRSKLAAVKCYKGGIAAKNAAGFLTPATDTAGLVVVGIFEETVDNSGGAAGDLEASYITGVEVELVNAGGAINQDDLQAYVSDDQSVTTAAVAAHDIFVGPVTEWTATKVVAIIDEAVNFAPSTVGTPFDGADVDTVADNNVLGGVPVEHIMAVPDAATGDVTIVFTKKTEITRINGFKTAGAGAAGNTYQFKNGATAITDAIDGNVADKVVLNPATVDDAQNVIAAGGSLVCTRTKAGGNAAARFFIHGVLRA